MNNTLTPADLPSLCILTAGLLASGHFSSRKSFQGTHGALDEAQAGETGARLQVVPVAVGLLAELKHGLSPTPDSAVAALDTPASANRREMQLGLLAMFGDDGTRAAVEAGTMTLDDAETKIRAEQLPRMPLVGISIRQAIADRPDAFNPDSTADDGQAVS